MLPPIFPPTPELTPPEIPGTHRTQVEEPWSEDPVVKEARENANAELQSLSDKNEPTHYDEYSFVVDEMPPGVTPPEFLNQMMRNLNGTVNNPEFDGYSDFKPRVTSGEPQVGDIVDISLGTGTSWEDIIRVNGSVMLTEITSSSFTYSTITNEKRFRPDNSHPINGSREFGFEVNSDGTTRFYTRAATRPHDITGDIGKRWADRGWREWNQGLVKQINRSGGKARPDIEGYKGYRWDENTMDPRLGDSMHSYLLAMKLLDEAYARLQNLAR